MTAPAVLPAMPAVSSLPSAPAPAPSGAPGGDASPSPFDQHLQAARNSRSSDTPPAHASNAPRQDAGGKDGASSADGKTKPAQESNMPTTIAAHAANAAAGASSATGTGAAQRGQTDATLADAVLTAAQNAADAAGDAATASDAKPATDAKTDTPDTDGAATLAGAMLAMLGQVTGGAKGAPVGEEGGKVSADGSASGRGKAAALLRGLAQGGDQANAAATGNTVAATPLANMAAMLNQADHAPATIDTGAHKDPGLDALAMATVATLPSPIAAQAPALPQLQLSSPVDSSGFANELGQQVLWLGQQGIQQAKIRLNPQDLGSLDVHLSVSHDRVDVVFSAQHPAAVTAVQQSLPQLDHMLNRHGLSLGHAEVGQQQSRGDDRSHGGGDGASASTDEIGEVQGVASPAATGSRVGLLDAFA